MAAVDIISKSNAPLVAADSNIGKIFSSFGGVGRNTAECLARLKAKVALHSVVGTFPIGLSPRTFRNRVSLGDDYFGKVLRDGCSSLGINTKHILTLSGEKTAVFNATLNSDGEEFVSVNDMGIIEAIEKGRALVLSPLIT